MYHQLQEIDGYKIEDLSRSQEARLRTALAYTGDDGVEAINRLDKDTVQTLLSLQATCGGSGLSTQDYGESCLERETITEAIRVVLEASDENLSANEIERVVQRLDSPETETQLTAIRLVAETGDEGVQFIDTVIDLRRSNTFDFDEGDSTDLINTMYVYKDVSGKNVRDIGEIQADLDNLTVRETKGLGEALKERTSTDSPDEAEPREVKDNFKGADGELDAGNKILDSDKSIKRLSRTIRGDDGREIVEIDIELENGDVIEVKNVNFTAYKKDGNFVQRERYKNLRKKLKNYANATAKKDESLNGQRIIVAARGSPSSNPDLETLKQTIESYITDEFGWEVEVIFRSINKMEDI